MDAVLPSRPKPGERIADRLCAVPLFRGLNTEELGVLAATGLSRVYARGQEVPASDLQVLVVVTGATRLVHIYPGGRELTLARFVSRDVYSPRFSHASESAAETVLRSLTRGTEICALPADRIVQLMERHSEMARCALEIARSQAARAYEMAKRLAGEDLRHRVIDLILQLDAEGILEYEDALTHEVLASMVWATREKTTQAINRLQRERLIGRRASHGIEILDIARLRSELNS